MIQNVVGHFKLLLYGFFNSILTSIQNFKKHRLYYTQGHLTYFHSLDITFEMRAPNDPVIVIAPTKMRSYIVKIQMHCMEH